MLNRRLQPEANKRESAPIAPLSRLAPADAPPLSAVSDLDDVTFPSCELTHRASAVDIMPQYNDDIK